MLHPSTGREKIIVTGIMKAYRQERLQSEIKKIFNRALITKMNDHRLEWVIVTDVVLSKDLCYLKVYFSHYNNPLTHDKIKSLLERAAGFFKNEIAGAKIMRTIPEITFYYDPTEDRAARMESILASVKDDFDDEDDFDPDEDLDDLLDDDDFDDFDDEDEDFDDIDDIDEDDEE